MNYAERNTNIAGRDSEEDVAGEMEDRTSFPKVLRLEKGFPCYNAVHESRLAWRLSVYARALSYLYRR